MLYSLDVIEPSKMAKLLEPAVPVAKQIYLGSYVVVKRTVYVNVRYALHCIAFHVPTTCFFYFFFSRCRFYSIYLLFTFTITFTFAFFSCASPGASALLQHALRAGDCGRRRRLRGQVQHAAAAVTLLQLTVTASAPRHRYRRCRCWCCRWRRSCTYSAWYVLCCMYIFCLSVHSSSTG
jgi:hypothetical protein